MKNSKFLYIFILVVGAITLIFLLGFRKLSIIEYVALSLVIGAAIKYLIPKIKDV